MSDFPVFLARATGILMESRSGLEKNMENSHNPKLLRGHARLAGRDGKAFRALIGDA